MKNLFLLIVCTSVIPGTLMAQQVDIPARKKMEILSLWAGRWQGEGFIQRGPGEPRKSIVDEHIEYKLEGTVLLIEGIGKTIDQTTKAEKLVHHALGILSYNLDTNQYNFKSYLNDGKSTEAWFTPVGENTFHWGFDIPSGGKIKYLITIDPTQKTWNEIGEFSQDGTNWMKFFEMNLKKTE